MSKSKGSPLPAEPPRYLKTLRLTFRYEGENVRLVSQESVSMVAPAPTMPPPEKGQSGFWYEARDRRGRPLFTKSIFNPIRFEQEVFPEDPQETPYWVPIKNPAGLFELLVPDIPEAEEIVLFSSPLEPEKSGQPAQELASFPLREPAGKAGKEADV